MRKPTRWEAGAVAGFLLVYTVISVFAKPGRALTAYSDVSGAGLWLIAVAVLLWAAKFAPTSAAPKAIRNQNQRVRPWCVNPAHNNTATAISHRPAPLTSENAVRARPGLANTEMTVYTSRKPATAPASHRVGFLILFYPSLRGPSKRAFCVRNGAWP